MFLDLSRRLFLELEKIALGAFAPLSGFMTEGDFISCVESMRLENGAVFTIPIVFDVPTETAATLKPGSWVECRYANEPVGRIKVESLYRPDKAAAAEKIFGTRKLAHPGFKKFVELGEFFVGGPVELFRRCQFEFSEYEMTPEESRAFFKSMGWKTVVGFQTRNVPHRAHEYLQKSALEMVDGIFLQPLVGEKKAGDFSPLAVIRGYEALIQNYYPKDRAKLGILSTLMRYAGPREAVFHALVRRNYGCTHFIVGRDHAGVGGYYPKYGGHALVERFESDLGIQVLKLCGPYLCTRCDGIATEKTCPHSGDPEVAKQISGSWIRGQLAEGQPLDLRIIRPEVAQALQGIDIFVD